jgi:hypothetical protein
MAPSLFYPGRGTCRKNIFSARAGSQMQNEKRKVKNANRKLTSGLHFSLCILHFAIPLPLTP